MSTRAATAYLVALLLAGRAAEAQTGRVSIEVDRHIVSVGEPVQVTVTIEVTGQTGYDQYLPPAFTGFQVSGGGMSTQNIEIINWQVRRREGHVYSVVATKEGAQVIGPAAVQIGGRVVRSNTVTVQVRRGTAPPPPSEPDSGALSVEGGDEPVFLAAVANPRKVFVGQQVVVVWYLFTQSDVLGFQPTTQPSTDNFWAEDLQTPRRLEFERRLVKGRPFHAAVIARKALFPQQAGTLNVGPLGARLRTLEGFSAVAVDKQSETIAIEVAPLPAQGRPQGFADVNVGRFEIAAALDRQQVKAGEGVTLRIVVRGSGNLRQLKLPTLESLEGFKVYKPKIEERLGLEQGVEGEKILEYLLLPVRGGTLRVPPLRLDYFDPDPGAYKQVQSAPLTLAVVGSLPPGMAPDEPGDKNVLGPTIRPPRPARPLSHQAPPRLQRSPVFLALAGIPVLVLLVLGGGDRLRALLRRETPATLRRAAARKTRAQLAQARELKRRGDRAAFFAALAAGLRSVLDHRLETATEGLTRDELGARMRELGFVEELVGRSLAELDACDAARFAPGAAASSELGQAFERVERLVDELGCVRLEAPRRRA